MSGRVALLTLIPFGLCIMALAVVKFLYSVIVAPDRAWRVALGVDRLGNAVFNGDPSELMTARATRARANGRRWGCVLCKLLDRIDPGHCDRMV